MQGPGGSLLWGCMTSHGVILAAGNSWVGSESGEELARGYQVGESSGQKEGQLKAMTWSSICDLGQEKKTA